MIETIAPPATALPGNDVREFLSQHIEVDAPYKTVVLMTSEKFNIDNLYNHLAEKENFEAIVNLKKVNDYRYINKFIESVNTKLENNGLFVCCIETAQMRKKRILNKLPFIFNYTYYFFDYLFKRVFPKIIFLRKIYYFITAGRNRVLSHTEMLGRLYSCGFKLVEEKIIGFSLFIVAQKIRQPLYDMQPSYAPVYKMKRLGKNGKIIHVYKIRTMHAYSEYLQEYIYEKNKLAKGGKFNKDFRVTLAGKILRKFWIDELPMIYNLLKGDIKLVGVRPLSEHFFRLYPEDFQKYRLQFKPGLVPPYYADMPKTLEEVIASEKKYLEAYQKSPLYTDFIYFWKAFNNIVFKNARSN